MEESFDYNQVPTYFVHCFNARCPRAGECLRQLAARHVTAVRPTLQVVNPAVWPAEGAACPQFKPIRRVQEAWGVRDAIGRMPYREARRMIRWLNQAFPRMTLSRIVNHKRPLTPEEQQQVVRAFRERGMADEQVFAYVTDSFEW